MTREVMSDPRIVSAAVAAAPDTAAAAKLLYSSTGWETVLRLARDHKMRFGVTSEAHCLRLAARMRGEAPNARRRKR